MHTPSVTVVVRNFPTDGLVADCIGVDHLCVFDVVNVCSLGVASQIVFRVHWQ